MRDKNAGVLELHDLFKMRQEGLLKLFPNLCAINSDEERVRNQIGIDRTSTDNYINHGHVSPHGAVPPYALRPKCLDSYGPWVLCQLRECPPEIHILPICSGRLFLMPLGLMCMSLSSERGDLAIVVRVGLLRLKHWIVGTWYLLWAHRTAARALGMVCCRRSSDSHISCVVEGIKLLHLFRKGTLVIQLQGTPQRLLLHFEEAGAACGACPCSVQIPNPGRRLSMGFPCR